MGRQRAERIFGVPRDGVGEVVADQADHDAVAQGAVEPETEAAGRLPRREPHVDDADQRRRHPLQYGEGDAPHGEFASTPVVRQGQRRHADADEEDVGDRSEPEQPAEGQVWPPRDQDCADRTEAQQFGRRRLRVVQELRARPSWRGRPTSPRSLHRPTQRAAPPRSRARGEWRRKALSSLFPQHAQRPTAMDMTSRGRGNSSRMPVMADSGSGHGSRTRVVTPDPTY